jgi:hypothetical protein
MPLSACVQIAEATSTGRYISPEHVHHLCPCGFGAWSNTATHFDRFCLLVCYELFPYQFWAKNEDRSLVFSWMASWLIWPLHHLSILFAVALLRPSFLPYPLPPPANVSGAASQRSSGVPCCQYRHCPMSSLLPKFTFSLEELNLDGCAPESVQEITFADRRLGHASGVHHTQPV